MAWAHYILNQYVMRKVYKVYKLVAHKLFTEEEGPYYNRRTINGFYLQETDIEHDSEQACLDEVVTKADSFYDFVILLKYSYPYPTPEEAEI